MELTQAIQLINEAIAVKQAEMDTLRLTLFILEARYAPELAVLDNAREEASIAKAETVAVKQEVDELKTEVDNLKEKVRELELKESELEPRTTTPVVE